MTHAYYLATISRGALIGLILGAVIFAFIAVLIVEWLFPDQRDAPYDWARECDFPVAGSFDRRQDVDDASLVAFGTFLNAVLPVDADERWARSELGYPNVRSFRKPENDAA